MFQTKCFLFCLISYFILESNAYDASYIKPCKAEDEACMLASANAAVGYVAAGIQELGVPQADPIFIKNVRSDLNNLKLQFSDIKIVGPGKAKILKVAHDTSKKMIKAVIETPISISGHYDLQGKILFINAVGNGPYKLDTDNIVFNVEVKYKIIEKNGNKYWKITEFDYTYDLVKKVHIKFENLFGGDDEAAKPINQLLDENWKEIIIELGDQIMKQNITEYINIVKKLFLSIPADKLSIN